MRWTNGFSAIIALSLAAVCSAAFAQPHDRHHDRHGVSTHRSGISINLFSPRGQPVVREHHDDYRFVVPATRRYGTYYTHEDVHYFTPPALPVVVNQPVVVQRPVQVEFGTFRHYEQLAERLETLANQLCLDLHYNYQHNRNYDETYREAYQLMQLVKFIHGSEHRGDRTAIRKSADDLDELFHHVQRELKSWTRAERRQVGEYGLMAKVEELEALIHHLLFDVGVKPDHNRDEDAPPPREEVAPPPAPRRVKP